MTTGLQFMQPFLLNRLILASSFMVTSGIVLKYRPWAAMVFGGACLPPDPRLAPSVITGIGYVIACILPDEEFVKHLLFTPATKQERT